MPSPSPTTELPLEQRRRALQWTRWFHYSLMLSLVAGLLAFAPLPFTGADDSVSWWPFGGDTEAPETAVVDVAVGDGTAEMELDWTSEIPGAATYSEPGQVETAGFEADPQDLDLRLVDGRLPTGYVEGLSRERVSERTETTTVFANPDGTNTLRIYQTPAFAADDEGELVPIDPDLERGVDGRWSPAAAAEVSFADTAAEEDIIAFSAGEGAIAYGMAGAAAVAAAVEGHTITYPEVRPATDLRFTVAGWGAKADIVLADASAATTWTFPLDLDGLTAEVDEASGSVLFLDAAGEVAATVPAGYAEDAAIDPVSGEGARTYAVEYEIVTHEGDPALRVTLDEAWFDDPDRVFPITVDPTLSASNGLASGDTYVQKPYNNNFSGEGEIKVGYVSGNTSAGLLKFDNAKSALKNKYIRGVTLSLYNTYSWSCSARAVKIHRITESWTVNSSKTWPGPAFDATAAASKSFAHGYSSSCGDAWETFTLDPWQFTGWVHGAESFYGFRIEASRTDEKAYKRFASLQSTIPGSAPFLDVVYADQGATYKLPTGGFTTPVTAASTGTLPVTITNWGSATWKAGTGYGLRVIVYNRSTNSAYRAAEGTFYAPKDVAPRQSATFTASVAPLPPGQYKLYLSMVDPQGKWFSNAPYHLPDVTANFNVVNLPPQIKGNSPGDGAVVDSNRPTLWVQFNDADSPISNARYEYKICRGPEDDMTDCQSSGTRATAAWKIPEDFLQWGETAFWYARVSDGTATSAWTPGIELTPQPAQPPVTSHLAGASDGSTVPGLNPQVGNFTTTVTDAWIEAVGPMLAARRTYNSQDLRTSGAFGTGWSTPWDQRLIVEPEATVLVVLESGRTVRFGENPDGSFASPFGESLELEATSTGWRMRDTSGSVREFNTSGELVRIVDAFGRGQTLAYTAGKLTTVTDDASGRHLDLEWTGSHVTAVVVPAAQDGGADARWTYAYEGDLLTEACTPISNADCETYAYESTSFYEAAVQDANPKAYYTFDDLGNGASVANRAANVEDEYNGDRIGLLHTPVGGALAASDGRALDLGSSPLSVAQLPDNLFGGTVTVGVELWFRSEPGESGILFSLQNANDGATPTCFQPLLYVDTAGRLRSGLAMDSGSPKRQEFVSTAAVDDGQWHHVVLTSAATQQWLYLDGAAVATESGRTVDQANCGKAVVGNGWGTSTWPGMSSGSGYKPYSGEIDDLSLYTRALTGEEVAFRHASGETATARMTSVVNDQGHAVWSIDYDRTTGRVSALTDMNGATWSLAEPLLTDTDRMVMLSSDYGKSEQYTYDAARGGRLVSRSDAIGTATWTYNDQGFIAGYEDEAGLTTVYTTDDKGRRTAVTTCRAEDDCATSRMGYYSAADPFDLREGRLLWTSDGRSASAEDTTYRTVYTYNTEGQLLTTAHPGTAGSGTNPSGTTAITYTAGTEAAVGGGTVPAGLTAALTDETGAQTLHFYNAAGDLVETLAASGQVTRYGYDLLGRRTSTQIGAYEDGQFTARDTVTETLDALGRTLTSTGTAFANPVTETEHQLHQTYAYDGFGRLTSVSSRDEADPAGVRVTSYDYDAAGRLTETVYPDGSTAAQRWNTAGLLETETTATGVELAHTYDQRGRLITTSAVGEGVDTADPEATELLLEYRTYFANNWAASSTDALGRKTSWEYWGDGTVEREVHTAPNGTETVLARYEYDAAGNLTSATDAVGTVTEAAFNARNWPTSTVVDPAGIAAGVDYTYDEAGRATGLQHRYGGVGYKNETFDYDQAGNVTGTWTTAPTVAGDCRTVDGHSCVVATSANTYTNEGLLVSTQVGEDGAATYTYNSLGQIATATGPAREVWIDGVFEGTEQPVTIYGYNAFGELTHLEDPDGNVIETEYDTSGRPVRTLLPPETVAGSTVPVRPQHLTSYLPGGLIASEADPRGATTTYEYDQYGRVLTVTAPDPDGEGTLAAPVTTYTYDRAGHVITTTDPNGALTTATYDDFGRLATATATERAGGDLAYFTSTYAYDEAGRRTAVTTPGGHTTTTAYDPLGRPVTVTDPTGVTVTTAYPNATTATVTFDDGGDGIDRRQSAITDVLGNTVQERSEIDSGTGWTTVQCAQSSYDLAGRPIAATTVARSACADADTTYTYDEAGQLTDITGAVTDMTAITIALGYDRSGHLTRMVDGNGNTTVYGFNAWGLQDTTVEPETAADPGLADRTWTTVYDIAGNAVEQHLPGGVVQTAAYDRLGRKTTESGTGAEAPTTVKHYGWDAMGNLTGFSSDLGDTQVEYNDRGLMTAITGVHEGTFAYDADGRLTERTDAAGTTGFTYDDAGRLTALTDPLTDATHNYTWRGDGQLDAITTTGASRTFDYAGYGQLTSDTVTSGSVQRSIDYTYDGALLTAKTTDGLPNAGTDTYEYDDQGRLISWTGTDGIATTYTWDANANRIATDRWDTECGDQAAETRLFVYDERNRLTEAMDGAVQCIETEGLWEPQSTVPTADETWTYTARGTTATHETSEGTTAYTFDAFEQLKTAVTNDGAAANLYDALGRLISRNGATFAYDGLTNNLVAAPASNGGIDRTVRDPHGGAVTATHDGITGLSWTNTHGDLVALINPDTGDVITGGGFDPFGSPLPDTTASTTGFQGGYTDPATGEVNAHARWYNPDTATFTSRDTWQLTPTPIAQTNRYQYANASPLSHTDTNGHLSVHQIALGGAQGGRGGVIITIPVIPIGSLIEGSIIIIGGVVGTGACLTMCSNPFAGANSYSGSSTSALANGNTVVERIVQANGNTLVCTRAGNCWVEFGGTTSNGGNNGGGGGCGTCTGGGGGGGGGRNPWRPAPPRIDWNAYNTRPQNTAQEAAEEDRQRQIDILEGALMENEALLEDLIREGYVIADDGGNITDIVYMSDWDDCASEYNYGPAPSNRATYAFAFLCGKDLERQGPGSEASDSVALWDWPSENEEWGSPVRWLYDRCHLIANKLGGSGKVANNLVTCYGYPMNRQDMRLMIESPVQKQVEREGEHILYISVPQYNSSGTLTGIRVSAFGDKGTTEDMCFGNTPGVSSVVYGTNC